MLFYIIDKYSLCLKFKTINRLQSLKNFINNNFDMLHIMHNKKSPNTKLFAGGAEMADEV